MAKRLVWRGLFILMWCVCFSVQAEPEKTKAGIAPWRVLYINSYSTTYSWTNDVLTGFRNYFQYISRPVTIDTIELDVLSKPDLSVQPDSINLLQQLLDSNLYDLVVAVNAPAVELFFQQKLLLPEKIPLIFGGYPIWRVPELAYEDQTTGVAVPELNLQSALLAAKLLPDLTDMVVITDGGDDGRMINDYVSQHQKELKDINLTLLNGLEYDTETLLKELIKIPESSVVILNNWAAKTDAGNVPDVFYNVLPRLRAATKAPFFVTQDNGAERFALGGIMISARRHGQALAEITGRILRGEKAGDIPVQTSPAAIVFSYPELEQYKLSPDMLPENAKLINDDVSEQTMFRRRLTLWVPPFLAIAALVMWWGIYKYYKLRSRLAFLRKLNRFSIVVDANGKIIFNSGNSIILKKLTILELPDGLGYKLIDLVRQILLDGNHRCLEFDWNQRRYRAQLNRIFCGIAHKVAVAINIDDIDDLHKARCGIMAISDHLRRTLNVVTEALVAIDLNGGITFVNPAAVKLLGLSGNELIGKRALNVFNLRNFANDNLEEPPFETAIKEVRTVDLGETLVLLDNKGRRYHIKARIQPLLQNSKTACGAVMTFTDITAEYEQKTAYLQKLNTLKETVKMAGIVYFHCSTDSIPGFENLPKEFWGWNPDGTPCRIADWVLPEDCDNFLHQWRLLLKNEVSAIDITYRVKSADLMQYFRMTVHYLTAPNSRKKEYLGIIRNVTKERRHEKELYDANFMLTRIMENLPCYIAVKNVESGFRYLSINKNLSNLLGVSQEDIVGKTDFDIFKDGRTAVSYRSEDVSLLQTNAERNCITDVVDQSGRRRTLKLTKKLLIKDIGERLILTTAVDITGELKYSEDLNDANLLIHNIVDNLPHYVFVKDIANDFRYTECNSKVCCLLGKSREQIIGKTDLDLFSSAEEAAAFLRDDRQAAESNEPLRSFHAFTTPDAGTRQGEFFRRVITRANGEKLLLGVVYDITNETVRENAIHYSNNMLQGILDNLPCFLSVKDYYNGNKFVICNRHYYQMLNRPEGSLIGSTDADIFPPELVGEYQKNDVAIMENGIRVDTIEPFTKPDGSKLSLYTRKVRLPQHNGMDYLLSISLDMTELVSNRNKLQETNSILQAILNHLPAMIVAKDVSDRGKYVIWNHVAENASNISAAEVLGRSYADIAGLSDKFALIEEINRIAMENGRHHSLINFSKNTKSGEDTEIIFDVQSIVIGTPQTRQLLISLGVDVTEATRLTKERHKLVENLKDYAEQERVFNICLEKAVAEDDYTGGIQLLLATIGRRMKADRCFMCIYNETSNRAMPLSEWVAPGITPQLDKLPMPILAESAEPWLRSFRDGKLVDLPLLAGDSDLEQLGSYSQFAGGGRVSSIFAVAIRHGERLYGHIALSFESHPYTLTSRNRELLYAGGHIMEILLLRKIAAESLERSEYEKRLILDTIKIPIMLFNPNLDLVRVNNAAVRITGKTESEILSKPCYMSFCGDTCRAIDCPVVRALADHQSHSKNLQLGGRDYRLDAYPIILNGELLYILKTLVDMTDANATQKQLTRALLESRNAEQAKGMFLATVSHELRTPLNAVIGFSELLNHADLTPETRREYLTSINLSGNALLKLINDILDLSKLDAKQMKIFPEKTDLANLCKEIAAIFRYRIESKKLDFVLKLPDKLPWLWLDAARIRQIILNLLGNAVKFTDHGSITLNVLFNAANSAEGDLTIEVSDTGIGISNEYQQKIFEPFVQDKALHGSKAMAGTGLGLPIVVRLVKCMNGSLQLNSKIGVGSSFTLQFKHVKYVSSPPEEKVAVVQKITMEPGKYCTKVLIVDDLAINLQVLKGMLNLFSCEVRTAVNGLDALKVLADYTPEIILTDLWMPEMDGTELLTRLKKDKRWQNIPVWAVTADSTAAAGFTGIIAKPVNIETLKSALIRSKK